MDVAGGFKQTSDCIVHQAARAQDSPPDEFAPFRVGVDYLPAQDAPIKPLIEYLSFIRSKAHRGAAFRFGFLCVSEVDFARIAAAMGRNVAMVLLAATVAA